MKTPALSSFVGLCILAGCAGSPAVNPKADKLQSLNVASWVSVQLTDVANQPVITEGQSADEKSLYIQVSTSDTTKSYWVDLSAEPAQLKEVADFSAPVHDVIQFESHVRDVQKTALWNQYAEVWRCRYSASWRAVASRDLRQEGPLLLGLQQFNPNNRDLKLMIAIDQSTFAVMGLSGIKEPMGEVENMDFYSSSIVGKNYVFGLTSNATATNSNFFVLCVDAYQQTLPDSMRGITTPDAYRINYLYEKQVSKDLDIEARLKSVDLNAVYNSVYAAEALDVSNKEKLRPDFNFNAIENLIKAASSGSGDAL